METFEEVFEKILKGDREESRLASKAIRKLIYKRGSGSVPKIIDEAFWNYCEIKEEWRQEIFVRAIASCFFLRNRRTSFGLFVPWLLQLLEHKNGNIRYASVRMINHELGSLTFYLRFPKENINAKTAKEKEENDRILFILFIRLIEMSLPLQEYRFRECEYVDLLPNSPFKSMQMVLSDIEYFCPPEYVRELERRVKEAILNEIILE